MATTGKIVYGVVSWYRYAKISMVPLCINLNSRINDTWINKVLEYNVLRILLSQNNSSFCIAILQKPTEYIYLFILFTREGRKCHSMTRLPSYIISTNPFVCKLSVNLRVCIGKVIFDETLQILFKKTIRGLTEI